MRGEDERSGSLFSYVDLEARVGQSHPLRAIRALVNEAPTALASDFSALYSPIGRPSIPPEKLLRAMLLQAFYSIRSERQLMERLEFDLLFRWFVGLGIDDPVWDHSGIFQEPRPAAGGRHRGEAPERGAGAAAGEAAAEHDHFSVDGTLIEAWASMKSFRPRKGADEPPADGGGATGRRTSTARSARTRRTPRPPIRMRGSIAKGRQGGQALLHGACADGEPQRPGGRCLSDASRSAMPSGSRRCT